jgi:tripartite-type tricarboxylate transporter receptor subunit TctC
LSCHSPRADRRTSFARIVGEYFSKSFGQQFIIENIAGAGGTTGITRGAQAKPDGYTIMMGHMGTHSAAPALYPNLKYDPNKDFAPHRKC